MGVYSYGETLLFTMTAAEKQGDKHERLAGLRRGSCSGMVSQGLWNVKATVIRRTVNILETCKRTLCWQKITEGSFRV